MFNYVIWLGSDLKRKQSDLIDKFFDKFITCEDDVNDLLNYGMLKVKQGVLTYNSKNYTYRRLLQMESNKRFNKDA